MKTIKEITEAIKGWKHAHSDIAKSRAAQGKDVVLHSLKKDGTESGMSTARKNFRTEAEARAHHENMKKLNPTRKIMHNLYVDGKVEKLDYC